MSAHIKMLGVDFIGREHPDWIGTTSFWAC